MKLRQKIKAIIDHIAEAETHYDARTPNAQTIKKMLEDALKDEKETDD